MSKIAFFCIPAQGHTNPTLPVVRELVRRGHQVRYYSYNAFREKIEAAGAEFIPCDSYDIQMTITPEDGARIGTDIVFSTELIVNTVLAMDDTIIREMAQWKPECIVADSVATWGKLAAWKLGIPLMSSTTTFAFNRYSAKTMKQPAPKALGMLFDIPKANRLVRKLREKGYPVKNILSVIANDNDTNTIVYTSPKLQPASETFSEKYTFVGPSIRAAGEPAARTGRKTVYISLGTVVNLNTDFYRRCMAALGSCDFDVILSVGQFTDIPSLGEIPENFTVANAVNQIEVLQKADAFLTHCGMNSVNEALYFGVPLVLFPQTPEQGSVAGRVSELGAGFYLRGDDSQSIRAAIETVLGDSRFAQGAAEISADFRRCGGSALAADKIEALIAAKKQ